MTKELIIKLSQSVTSRTPQNAETCMFICIVQIVINKISNNTKSKSNLVQIINLNPSLILSFIQLIQQTMIPHKPLHRLKILMALIVCSLFITVHSDKVADPTCSLQDDQFLVTFHPHLDAFWLNTDEQLKNINFRPAGFLYNMNQRNSKQIFNSMYDALMKDSKRKYFVSQIVFFKDWYEYLDQGKRENVKKLLKNGQLDIANSGWVQNDEAVCYYDDILDQYTVGMNWMYEEFGYVNKIGWATDSFGHSHSQVALEHLLGFEFQGIERVDDRYIHQHKPKPLLEFYWQPVSDSNGKKYGGVLNHVRHFLHEVNDLRRIPSNSITQDFRTLQKVMKPLYNKNKFFRFLGNDFQQFTNQEFQNLQHSLTQLNGNTQNPSCVKYKYGNPKDYLETVKPYWSKNKVETRQFDLMSNWDQDRYWAGYFTTDPELKIVCKRFSRLVNFVRKVLVKAAVNDVKVYDENYVVVARAEELLAIMQHHDGITATSKEHIERGFKNKMAKQSLELIEAVRKVFKPQALEECRLFENHNTCNISSKLSQVTLSILHQGVAKKQRIEIILPQKWIYTVQGIESYLVVSPLKYISLIFEAEVKPGRNDFLLKGEDLTTFKGDLHKYQQKSEFNNGEGIKVTMKQNNKILYEFGENHFEFSIQFSPNNPQRRETVYWTKYNEQVNQTQTVQPGIYIMANNGQLTIVNPGWQKMQVVEFGNYYRVFFDGPKIDITLTFLKSDPSILEHQLVFTPPTYSPVDYFLHVSSNIINPQNQFLHDANGYLVSKRKIGHRPDYQWIYKPEDKINANTYAACSFIYQENGEEKVVAFLDRAQGVTTYDGSLMINVDRLAGDDYKGVGEGYSFVRENRFNFKFGVTSKEDDVERVWQRQYDDSLVGFFTSDTPVKNEPNLRKTPTNTQQYLKYSTTFLNRNQILLRVHNLAQHKDLTLPHFKKTSWLIDQLNLNLTYKSIRQSFANGLIFKQRYNWIGDSEEINHITRGGQDTEDSIVLRPLEIRSWRINVRQDIVDREVGGSGQGGLPIEVVSKVEEGEKKKLVPVKHSLRKRCFS